MNPLICKLHLLSGLLILIPLPSLAGVVSKDMACQQMELGTELPSVPQLPALVFCSPVIGKGEIETNIEGENNASFLDNVIEQNPSVQSYEMQVKSSEYSLKSANGAWWPSVSMSNSSVLFTDILSSQNYGGAPNASSSPATAGSAFNPFNGSSQRDGARRRSSSELTGFSESSATYTQAYPVIQIQWNFLDPTRYPQIAAAKHQLALSKSQLLQATQQTRSAVMLTYGDYLLSGFQLAEILQLVNLQQQIVSQARERVNLKLLPRFQADQEFRTFLSYQRQLRSTQIQQSNAAVKLESLLLPLVASDGKKLSNAATAFSPLSLHNILGPSLEAWPWDRDETIKRSLSYSEALKRLMLQAAIATDNANEQWGGILPTIGLLGYVTYQYTAGSQNFAPPTQPSGARSSTLSNYAGLSISWNLFDGYATRNQAKSYEQTAVSYKAQYRDAATKLKTQTLESLNQLVGSEQLIALSLQDLQSAEQISSDTAARAAVGLAEQSDILSSKIQVHQSRLQLIQSLASYIKTFGELKRLAGS